MGAGNGVRVYLCPAGENRSGLLMHLPELRTRRVGRVHTPRRSKTKYDDKNKCEGDDDSLQWLIFIIAALALCCICCARRATQPPPSLPTGSHPTGSHPPDRTPPDHTHRITPTGSHGGCDPAGVIRWVRSGGCDPVGAIRWVRSGGCDPVGAIRVDVIRFSLERTTGAKNGFNPVLQWTLPKQDEPESLSKPVPYGHTRLRWAHPAIARLQHTPALQCSRCPPPPRRDSFARVSYPHYIWITNPAYLDSNLRIPHRAFAGGVEGDDAGRRAPSPGRRDRGWGPPGPVLRAVGRPRADGNIQHSFSFWEFGVRPFPARASSEGQTRAHDQAEIGDFFCSGRDPVARWGSPSDGVFLSCAAVGCVAKIQPVPRHRVTLCDADVCADRERGTTLPGLAAGRLGQLGNRAVTGGLRAPLRRSAQLRGPLRCVPRRHPWVHGVPLVQYSNKSKTNLGPALPGRKVLFMDLFCLAPKKDICVKKKT
eukprot:gene3397-biopygen692